VCVCVCVCVHMRACARVCRYHHHQGRRGWWLQQHFMATQLSHLCCPSTCCPTPAAPFPLACTHSGHAARARGSTHLRALQLLVHVRGHPDDTQRPLALQHLDGVKHGGSAGSCGKGGG